MISMKFLKFLPLLLLFSLLLAACGDPVTQSSDIGPIDSPASSTQPAVTPAVMAIGKFREYPLPQTNSGLMRPAIDHEGRIWFGESATDIWEQMEAEGIDTPLYYTRVGSDYYVRKGGHR